MSTQRTPHEGSMAATKLSATELQRRLIDRRAIETINWGISAVNYDLMLQSFVRDAKGGLNQIAYWSSLPTWKNQTLTPNPDAMYFMPFYSTAGVGPLVVEIPPAGDGSITGTLMDSWQVALEDVGPAGIDKGQGGKYLILPPGHKDPVPDGYIALPSVRYQGYALLRSILKSTSDADVAAAVAYGRRIKLYPLSQTAKPPPTKFVDALDVVLDGVIPYDVRFFQSLDRMVQTEPWIERDRVMIDLLKSLGIEKGKSFKPDARTKTLMKSAGQEALQRFDLLYETIFEPFNKGSRWFLPASKELMTAIEHDFSAVDNYPIDGRGIVYYFAFSSVKHMGAGQFYLFVTSDKAAKSLDGSKNYRLRVPPSPPVKQYWSVVLYDFATHALIRRMPWSSRSSLAPDLQTNPDGSVDVFFGPKAPGGKRSNWIPTSAKGRFEALFRFYGPGKPLFDKTWKLPDIERVK